MRPEGWTELGAHPCSGDGCLECRDYANREAGADAYEEGLMREGIDYSEPSIICAEDNTVIYKGKKGKLVFIEGKR